MRKKLFIGLIFSALLLMGVGCGKVSDLKTTGNEETGDELFAKYCDLFVNKFQQKDLESYDIDPNSVNYDSGYEVGYYRDVDSCVASMKKANDQLDEMCEMYGGDSGIDCDEAKQNRYKAYKMTMTYDGCMANGRGMRCGLFDTTQSNWAEADADQIADANATFAECLEKVKYACEDLPKSW